MNENPRALPRFLVFGIDTDRCARAATFEASQHLISRRMSGTLAFDWREIETQEQIEFAHQLPKAGAVSSRDSLTIISVELFERLPTLSPSADQAASKAATTINLRGGDTAMQAIAPFLAIRKIGTKSRLAIPCSQKTQIRNLAGLRP